MSDSNYTPTHEQIARRAYEIFIERGQPAGEDLAHWLEAERQLQAAGQQQSRPTAQVKSTTGFQTAATPTRSHQSNGRTASRAAARK